MRWSDTNKCADSVYLKSAFSFSFLYKMHIFDMHFFALFHAEHIFDMLYFARQFVQNSNI